MLDQYGCCFPKELRRGEDLVFNLYAFLERFQLWEQFQIYYDYNMVSGTGSVLRACGEEIHDLKDFRTAGQAVKCFCERENYAKAISTCP